MSETTTPATDAAATPAATPAPADTAPPVTASVLTDAKPADAAPPADAKPAEPAEPQAVEYKNFNLPDGTDAKDETLAAFQAEASKLGVSQKQAEAIAAAMSPKLTELQQRPWTLASEGKGEESVAALFQQPGWWQMNEKWQAEIKASPEFAGPKFDQMTASVGRLLDDFVGAKDTKARKDLDQALLQTSAGNNPHIVRAFARIASNYTESTTHVSGSPSRTPVDAAAMMYPKSAPAGANQGA